MIVRAFAGLAVLTLSFGLTLLIIDYTPEPWCARRGDF